MTRADLLALVLALGANLALYAIYWQSPGPANQIEVWAPDQAPQRFPLDTDRTIAVVGDRGISTLQIRNGRVRFLDSPCRNRICVHSGWHHSNGDAAACVPNGISIRLLGGGEVIDAIAF